MVVVRLGENDEALPPAQPQDKKAKQTQWEMGPVKQAALFVRDRAFQNFLNEKVARSVHDETTAIEAIYQLFDITSRKFLIDDPAYRKWEALMREYRDIWEQSHYGDMRDE